MAQGSVSKKDLNSDKRFQNSKSRDSIATEVKRSSSKTDGKAKVLGVASVATLLRPDRHAVPSARIPHAGPSMKSKKSSITPATRSNLTGDGDTPPIVTEDRSHMLKLAGQAIASSSCENTVYEHADASNVSDSPSLDHIQKMRSLVPASKQDQSAAQTLHTGYPLKRATAVTGSEIVNKAASVMSPTTPDSALRNELRSMVLGLTRYDRESQKLPGNYLAIDCEMVGLGYNGEESCLARVSIVNYHGYIVLDTFVRPKEKVTDWRTWVSGVRPQDMQHAPSFETVQTEVAKLLEGKIVIGHAVENDTKALLLSHPSPLLRDTQRNTALRQIAKTKMPGLKKLTELELGLKIQSGAHSSVTDARATMALYRLHKAEWEQQMWKETQAYLARQKRGNGAQRRPSKSTADTSSLLDKPLIAAESRPRKRKDSSEPAGVSKRANVQGMPSRGLGHTNWWED